MSRIASQSLPLASAVAFKEWRGIVSAVRAGRQSLLLRKGGVDEDRGVFTPEHAVFWLYPTELHQGQQGLNTSPDASEPEYTHTAGVVPIDTLVCLEAAIWVDRWERLESLAHHHTWTEETVRRRFAYRRPGLWVLSIRAYVRPTPYDVVPLPHHAGCRTWVELGEALSTAGIRPAVDEDTHAQRWHGIQTLLGGSAGALDSGRPDRHDHE